MIDKPLAEPVDPYDPPLPEIPYDPPTAHDPAPPPEPEPVQQESVLEKRGNRPLVGAVVALAVVLCVGIGVVIGQLTPSASTAEPPSTAAVTKTAAPVSDDPDTWPELAALPASEAVAAPDPGPETRIHFRNTGGASVMVSWINYDGERRDYAALTTGETYTQQTFAGQYWVVSGTDGTVLAAYRTLATPAQVVIR
ncbi:hypothetical protein [Actinoplanes sp. NBRC 101535]|uniref:VHL beta domain-containing protein n=1 Tax=Actinoplanes sp. NBRC 101535 TaxID=3032196 RepID=UPI0024A032C7|nr:hypothetical protein [Actinoplanes sp. NBRC 101535]GLY07660.1 hypothetical protein Acsp01_80390 [Actinoplanes sp. NBRC 101535]